MLIFHHIVLGSEGEFRDILHSAIVVYHQYIVFPVRASPRLPFGYGDVGLHRNHHVWLQHRLDVLAQLEACLPAVVMVDHSKRMTVAEDAILEQVVLEEDFVQFFGNVATSHSRLYQFQSPTVDFAVDFP